MNRHSTFALTAIASLFLGVGLPAGDAVGQQKTLKDQLVGTWTYGKHPVWAVLKGVVVSGK